MEDLSKSTYRELQVVAKRYKVPANIKRNLLVACIEAARVNDQKAKASIIEFAKLNRNRNRLNLKRKKSVNQQNGNVSVIPYNHSSKQLQLSGSSCLSFNDNSEHYYRKSYSDPRFFPSSFATELQTVHFSAFSENDFVGNSFSNEIYSKYAARKSDTAFPFKQFLQNGSSDILDARHSYYSSNTFYRQSYMPLPAIDNRDSTSSLNEFYRTKNGGNHYALSSSQNVGCNESSTPSNNTSYLNDQSRTLSMDYISSSNNDNLTVGTSSLTNYTPVVPIPQLEMNDESNWQTTNVHNSNTTPTNWALNSMGTKSNEETNYSAPVTQYASVSNPLTPSATDITSVPAEYDENSSDTCESISFPEEIAKLFTGSDTNAKPEESVSQTLSSSSGYSSMNSNASPSIQSTTLNFPSTNASSSIQPLALDYPSTSCLNLDTFCASVDSTAAAHANYELYYQPYWTNSYDNSTSIFANVDRSDTTTAATSQIMSTEVTTSAYTLPSFSSCFTNTNNTSGKNYEYPSSQQYWPSYYDTTASTYPYNNTSYATPVQPLSNVASPLLYYTPSPEPNCIDLTKTDDTCNNCATPLSIDDSSSASSLTIMEDAEYDTSKVNEAGFRNEKPLEDNYNHDTLMERSKIVCQHLPVKSIQEVRQLVQIYSPKVGCLTNKTQNSKNDEKEKPAASPKDVNCFPSHHPCAYKLEGCDYVSRLNYTRSHEKKCFFQPIYCPSDSCTWRHSFNSLSKHICECHEIEKRNVKLYLIDRLVEDREKERYTFYQSYENTIYIVKLRIYDERSLADVTIQYIPQDQSSTMNKKNHRGGVKLLSFTSKKIEKKEWKGMIQQYVETENKNMKDDCSVQINIRNSEYVIALVSIDHKN